MKKCLLISIAAMTMSLSAEAQSLYETFQHPPQEAKPLMIWQWMDGVVSERGITVDLEAYRDAGIGGVQQFLVGGEYQTIIRDTTNAIGTDNWKRLMKFAIGECERLGLSFGTHNCPGWSSSACAEVTPEYSMQKLTFSTMETKGGRTVRLEIPKPETDQQYDYYKDIAILAVPCDSVVAVENVRDLS
ncbi:MAG: glycosyl hydrolase, partial [Prevotella sp.]